MNTEDFPIGELFRVPSEDILNEDGEKLHCVYNRRVDAVTFVDSVHCEQLERRGIATIKSLPDDPQL